MLANSISIIRETTENIAYIGDKNEDGFAADANSIHFFKAYWGYGKEEMLEINSGWNNITKPDALLKIILKPT